MSDVKESDWKLFRAKVPGWQENYMGRLIGEYAAMLASSKNASEKFWELDKRIRENRKDAGVIIEMRRSTMDQNIIRLIYEGAITLEDLDGFSDELREYVARVTER